ncbi:MAG: hypothetical protein DLM61_07050 [Pseudonocardiales bacterium]|nr:MAG: hypothetical protein DLM61_07050 [Pseudonocardiales bacterium]
MPRSADHASTNPVPTPSTVRTRPRRSRWQERGVLRQVWSSRR